LLLGELLKGLWFMIGGGGEDREVDDGLGGEAELIDEMDLLSKLVFAIVLVVLCSAASEFVMLSCFFHFVRRFWNHILTWKKTKKIGH
jgi:hypothetical protein